MIKNAFDSRHEAYGKPVDVWSSGVTLCCLLFGYMPFGPEEEERLAKGENLKPGESQHI